MTKLPVPYPTPEKEQVNLDLPVGLRGRLKQVAWEQRRSLTSVVIEALEKYLAWDKWVKAQVEKKG